MEINLKFRKLNEEYNIVTNCGLLTCKGKKVVDDYAIVENWKTNTYSVTHIPSGLCVESGFLSLKDCKDKTEDCINRGIKYLKENPRRLKEFIEQYNRLLDGKIFANDI